MEYKWVIDTKALQEYAKNFYDRPSPEIIRKYYKGFNKMTYDHILKDEIAELEKVYDDSLIDMRKKVDKILPTLLHYMREFVELYDAIVAIEEKIEVLDAKLGRDRPKSCCQED